VDTGSLATVGGDLTVQNNDQLSTIDATQLTTVDGTLVVTDNPSLIGVPLPSLTSVGGSITVESNPLMTALSLDSLASVSGDMVVQNNLLLDDILFPSLGTTGDLNIAENDSATAIDFPSLGTTGDLNIAENDSATAIDFPSLGTTGDLNIAGNASLPGVALPSLETATSVTVLDNPVMTALSIDSLTSVSGDVIVTGNDQLPGVDAPLLSTVGGDLTIVDNPTLADPLFPSLTSVAGSVTMTGNDVGGIGAPLLSTVGGDLIVETTGAPTVDTSLTSVGGDLVVTAEYGDASVQEPVVSGLTSGGTTQIEIVYDEASTTVELPPGALPSGTDFVVTRLDPATLPPQDGLDAMGDPVQIDPVVAVAVTIGTGTVHLIVPANVAWEVPLTPELSFALEAGAPVTMAVLEDGGVWTVVSGAVVEGVTASGLPVPPNDPLAVSLRVTVAVPHFSTYAVATVDSPYCDPDGNARVDEDDVALIFAARGTPAAGPDDPADADGDGTITVLDSAVCADRCRYENCAKSPPAGCGLLGIEALLAMAPLAARRRRRARRAAALEASAAT